MPKKRKGLARSRTESVELKHQIKQKESNFERSPSFGSSRQLNHLLLFRLEVAGVDFEFQ